MTGTVSYTRSVAPTRLPRTSVVLVAALAVALAACSGDDTPAGSPSVETVATTTPDRVDDGVFVLGVVSPDTGPGVDIGQSVEAAVTLAADEINAAGGIIGQRVQVVQRDEGDNPAMALRAVQDLVQLGADAIVGPTSSNDLLATLSVTIDAGTLTCAPTATALALDAFPDRGLLLRTVPSDSLQAAAMARLVDESGSADATIVYLDDPYGRPLADAVQEAVAAQGTSVTATIGFTTDEERLAAAGDQIRSLQPDLVVVVADAVTGPLIIDAIEHLGIAPRPNYIVNDAVRRPSSAGMAIAGSLADRVQGVAPLTTADDAGFLTRLRGVDDSVSGLFAHDAYDCVNLIALAATSVDSIDPGDISAAVPAVSEGGTSCASFPDCTAELEAGRNIDYDGPSGNLAIGLDGDPDLATFERFGFDDNGRDITLGRFTVG